jgi:hypothetical protein
MRQNSLSNCHKTQNSDGRHRKRECGQRQSPEIRRGVKIHLLLVSSDGCFVTGFLLSWHLLDLRLSGGVVVFIRGAT